MDDGMILEIKRRALLLWVDNPRHYANLEAVEAAMTIGASIVVERGGLDPIPGEINGLLSSEQELADEDRWRHEEHIKDIRRMVGSTPSA
jgi:hypothetical protein